jgi:hypothetical protein
VFAPILMTSAIIFLVGIILGVSLTFAAIIALVVVIWVHDPDAAARLIGDSYYLLAGLMPLVLWCGLYVSLKNAGYAEVYKSSTPALLTTLQAAFVGSVLGAGPIFLAVVIYLPVIFVRFPAAEFGPTVRDTIVWSHLLIAVAAAVISAIPLGWWVHYAERGREFD